MNLTTVHFDSLPSTNAEAAEQARNGADEGLCIIAEEQTAGRGRHGREWRSEKGCGVYMSLVLRPKVDPQHLTLIPLLAAVAVHEVLKKKFAIDADIKWPNDLLVGDKKICGILSEAVETPRGLTVVLGIGINILNRELPLTATSIDAETGDGPDRDAIVEAVANEIGELYERFNRDPSLMINEWRQRSSFFEGKAVTVRTGTETFSGTTYGLEDNGALRVRTADGAIRLIHAGDVERLRADEIEVAG